MRALNDTCIVRCLNALIADQAWKMLDFLKSPTGFMIVDAKKMTCSLLHCGLATNELTSSANIH